MAYDNRTLGRFQLVGIPAAPRGIPQVEVTFDIDANGIVNVSAKDLATGKEQKITITSSSGLSKEDVDKMVRQAQENADTDKKKKEEVEVKNRTDSLIYSTEKTLKENKDKIPADEISKIEEALSQTKKAFESGDVEQMKKRSEELMQASHKMAEIMYKQAQASGPKPGNGKGDGASSEGSKPKDSKGDDVIDAEFDDVKN